MPARRHDRRAAAGVVVASGVSWRRRVASVSRPCETRPPYDGGVKVPEPPAPGAALLRVSEEALELVLEARAGEASPEGLALFVEISGADNGAYTYDIWFEAAGDAGPTDHVEHHGALSVVFPSGTAEKMGGATLDVGDDGLVILNPNSPPAPERPFVPGEYGSLEGPLAVRVLEILESEVNPQIAAHGGRADLVGVDDEAVAYVMLSGGCQGCGLAQVTLSQGIAVAIEEAVPEISRIVDVTAHAQGTNPYYQASKK